MGTYLCTFERKLCEEKDGYTHKTRMVIHIPNKLAVVQIVQLEAGSRVKEINT